MCIVKTTTKCSAPGSALATKLSGPQRDCICCKETFLDSRRNVRQDLSLRRLSSEIKWFVKQCLCLIPGRFVVGHWVLSALIGIPNWLQSVWNDSANCSHCDVFLLPAKKSHLDNKLYLDCCRFLIMSNGSPAHDKDVTIADDHRNLITW